MSTTEATPGVAPITEDEQTWLDSLPATVLHPHKSFRRKYRKIMVRFEQQMRESSSLFKDQQRLFDISQRIAEQNDQILSLLLELNTQPQIPSRLRFDLRDPAITNSGRSGKHEDQETARSLLRASRYKIQTGEIRQPEYQEAERNLLDSIEFEPQRLYAAYLKNGLLQRAGTQEEQEDTSSALIGGFLSSKLEETYLQALDDFLEGKAGNPRSHAASNLGSRHAERSVERERESQLRNPMSVYNWLRKNQPTVFLQDHEDQKAKPTTAAASRKSKRESILSKTAKTETETADDETITVEQSASKGGKRKRDDDGGYRPKGGHARPSKKRKDDTAATGTSSGKKSKRASMDIS